MAARLWYWRYY